MIDGRPLRLYIIAGEPSGDLLGAHLLRELKRQRPDVAVDGIGGPRMETEGLRSLFPFGELSLMGFVEILPHAMNLSARIGQTVEDIRLKCPDILVTIDSPGFCFRVIKRLKKESLGTKFVHYVAPSVWAYNPRRAKMCARLLDHLLALLPFEPPYFTPEGLACTFIGHPVVAETAPGEGESFRTRHGIPPETTLLCLLPGSRKAEIRRHMPIFARAVTLIAQQFPNLAIVVPVPRAMLEEASRYFNTCPFRAVVTADDSDKKNALAGANLVISKSGTVTLEVAMAGAPMIVAHRVNPISAWLFRKRALIRYVTLVNILANQEIIPELLQEQCQPSLIADAALRLLTDPQAIKTQREACRQELAKLKSPDHRLPSQIAAETILTLT